MVAVGYGHLGLRSVHHREVNGGSGERLARFGQTSVIWIGPSKRHLAAEARHLFLGLCIGSDGCLGLLGGSTWRRRSSVPSSFLGFGPGLML